MVPEKLTDPVLGDEGKIYGTGDRRESIFTKEFGPTKSRVLVLVDVVNGSVPQVQRDLYREVEAWYPKGVHEVFEAIRREVEKDEVLKKWLPVHQIPTLLQLRIINLRYPFRPPAKCVLEYRFDPDAPEWYVVISEDYHVEACGLKD